MKIRVTDRNKQKDEIYFEEITDIFACPYGDEGICLQIQVDTIDRKELNVVQDDVPYLIFLYFHCVNCGNKRPEINSPIKILEFEEILDEFRKVYLRYNEHICRGVSIGLTQ